MQAISVAFMSTVPPFESTKPFSASYSSQYGLSLIPIPKPQEKLPVKSGVNVIFIVLRPLVATSAVMPSYFAPTAIEEPAFLLAVMLIDGEAVTAPAETDAIAGTHDAVIIKLMIEALRRADIFFLFIIINPLFKNIQ